MGLDESGIPMTECGDTEATMCKLMPPIIEDQDTIDNLDVAGETMQAAAQAATITSLIVAILFGGVIQ
jgi:hypothetical protein